MPLQTFSAASTNATNAKLPMLPIQETPGIKNQRLGAQPQHEPIAL
jgi:hypothetical protein